MNSAGNDGSTHASSPSGGDLVRAALERARADAARRERQRRFRYQPRPLSSEEKAEQSREPVAFGAALREVVRDLGWQAPTAAATVLARWAELVGREVAAHARPVALRDGELVVEAESTAWATQLRLLSRQLLARLQQGLAELAPERGKGDDDVVRRIVVRGPTGPDWRHGRLRVGGGRGPRDTYG